MLYHYNPSTGINLWFINYENTLFLCNKNSEALKVIKSYHLGSIRAVVRFFVNLFVINMLTWLVFCTKEEDLVEWTKNENLTTCQFGEIVEMIVTHARNFDHKRVWKRKN